jgi:acyl-CoA reductase-like NAD-dependent aldehyde dehydrogenase
LKDEIIEEDDKKLIITRYTSLGVAVGIVPWNFPIHIACAKIIPAVLTGNPIIIKPSPYTPYCNLKLVELAQQIFPPGVVQALSGDDKLGPWLVAHPGIPKVSFTGSTVTGKKVLASASKDIKRVTLELYGVFLAASMCELRELLTCLPGEALTQLLFVRMLIFMQSCHR